MTETAAPASDGLKIEFEAPQPNGAARGGAHCLVRVDDKPIGYIVSDKTGPWEWERQLAYACGAYASGWPIALNGFSLPAAKRVAAIFLRTNYGKPPAQWQDPFAPLEVYQEPVVLDFLGKVLYALYTFRAAYPSLYFCTFGVAKFLILGFLAMVVTTGAVVLVLLPFIWLSGP